MNRNTQIIAALLSEIDAGNKKTRAGWARYFGVTYVRFINIVRRSTYYEFIRDNAYLPLRAERASGILFVATDYRSKRKGPFLRIPACAMRAAHFDGLAEVQYTAVKGRIVLEAGPTASPPR